MSKRRLALVTAALALWMESASAAPLPFFYLVPSGPATVPTIVPTTSGATYQFWVDPSGINTPGCTTFPPGQGLPTCVGTYGEGGTVVAEGSLAMTAVSASAAAFTTFNLQTSTELFFITGDSINGNSTPFEIGTLTIANDGGGGGDVTLVSGASPAQYVDAKFNTQNDTVPQVLAVAAPEPGTLLLLGAGLGGLSVAVRARRPRTN